MSKNNFHFYVLTGGIKTGKSTSILDWTKKKENVGGIVQLQDGSKRFIVDVSKREKRELTSANIENSIRVGKYYFGNDSIEWGKEILSAAVKRKAKFLIFDEYGISEFENRCFEPEISEIFKKIVGENLSINCIIVVREKLLKQFIVKFGNQFKPIIIKSVEEIRLED